MISDISRYTRACPGSNLIDLGLNPEGVKIGTFQRIEINQTITLKHFAFPEHGDPVYIGKSTGRYNGSPASATA